MISFSIVLKIYIHCPYLQNNVGIIQYFNGGVFYEVLFHLIAK